jgi:hypothetical protein
LEKLLVARQLAAEAQTDADATEREPLPEFKESETRSAEEATELLLSGAIRAVPVLSEARIRNAWLSVAGSWASQKLYEGSHSEISELVLRNLSGLGARSDFYKFAVKTYEDCAQVSAFLSNPNRFVGVRVWRSESKFFACGNAAFA